MLRVLWFLKNIVQGTHKPQPLDDSSILLFEQNKIGKHLAEVNLTKKTQLNKNLEKNAFLVQTIYKMKNQIRFNHFTILFLRLLSSTAK